MQSVPQSQSIDLDLVVAESDGQFASAASVDVEVRRPDGSVAVSGLSAARLRQGLWRFSFAVPSNASLGVWTVLWAVVTGEGAEFQAVDPFEVREAGSPFRTETTHISRATKGERVPLDVLFQQEDQPIEATSVSLSVYDPSGDPVEISEPPVPMGHGVFRSWWDAPFNARTGVYVASWTGTVDGNVVTTEEPFEVLAEDPEIANFSAGVDRIAVGSVRAFDAVYRTSDGMLWDPESPSVKIISPTGDVVFDRSPRRLATGVYREVLPLGVAGLWVTDWRGTDEGVTAKFMTFVEAVESGAGGPVLEDQHPFGATVEGVQALLPHFLIDHVSTVTSRQVGQHIENIGAQVSLRIGSYETSISEVGLVARVTAMAKYVTELGAAASTQDSGFPAQAGSNSSEYGAVLWERYNMALTQLIQVVDNATPGDDPGAGGDSGGGMSVYSHPAQFRIGMMT